ncbi:MAG: conjugal transfer protein TrbC [Desulfobacteraceae bacterium]|nr:conjugal transfer protein TrbC [Desulfobacteraceae bacterium]
MKKQVLLILGLNLLALLAATSAFAATGLPWEAPITTLRTSLTGPVAFGVAIIAIMITGAMLIWGGEINEFAKRGSYIVIVIGLLVAAQNAFTIFFPGIAGAGAII